MKRSGTILAGLGVLWLLAVLAGFRVLWTYGLEPGVPAAAPSRWPAGSAVQRDPARPTLVLLAHPHCPCSRASIRELGRLMAQAQGRLTAYVLFARLPGFTEDWTRTDLWRSAAEIPGVRVLQDGEGREARRLGAATSGQVVLYGADGRWLFSGGITPARGHSGDNAGRSAIVALLGGAQAGAVRASAVYGCSLFQPETRAALPGAAGDPVAAPRDPTP